VLGPSVRPLRGKANRIYKGIRHCGDTCNSDLDLRKLISTVNFSDLPVETWDLRSYWRSNMQLRSSLQWFAVVIVRINAWHLSSYVLMHGNCHRTHQRGTAWRREYSRHKQCLVSRRLFQWDQIVVSPSQCHSYLFDGCCVKSRSVLEALWGNSAPIIASHSSLDAKLRQPG
jgi:hypothetical protein